MSKPKTVDELTEIFSDLENSFLSFLREDPARTTPAPATMAAKQFELRIRAALKQMMLKALPKKQTCKTISPKHKNYDRGYNDAIDQVTKAIGGLFK
jgi:hypothetical protein